MSEVKATAPCLFCGGAKFHLNTKAKGYFLRLQMEREKRDTSNYLVRCTKCGAKGRSGCCLECARRGQVGYGKCVK